MCRSVGSIEHLIRILWNINLIDVRYLSDRYNCLVFVVCIGHHDASLPTHGSQDGQVLLDLRPGQGSQVRGDVPDGMLDTLRHHSSQLWYWWVWKSTGKSLAFFILIIIYLEIVITIRCLDTYNLEIVVWTINWAIFNLVMFTGIIYGVEKKRLWFILAGLLALVVTVCLGCINFFINFVVCPLA